MQYRPERPVMLDHREALDNVCVIKELQVEEAG